MKNQSKYLVISSIILAAYYIICGIHLSREGYLSQEALFYIEKSKIVLGGVGSKLKVIGLTAPIIPFYTALIFAPFNAILAPVIASSICTAVLFFFLASALLKNLNSFFYLFILLVIFVFHPGIIYAACSGKSISIAMIFFFLFFHNLLKFYRSNTTFHVSVSSMYLVMLIFCDFKFIWLSLCFIPLVLVITIQSLKLGERESIFRLFLSFNNPSLRRKLTSKTLSLYIILFALPLACVICYRLLNLTHANNLDYFTESPYSSWTVLADKLTFDLVSSGNDSRFLPQVSLIISARMIMFCPLILVAIYLFRESVYQILTLVTPFAFVEFLHIKNDKLFLVYEYYLIFLILSLLGLFHKGHTIKNQVVLKSVVGFLAVIQLYTGFIFLQNSSVPEEKGFITSFFNSTTKAQEDDSREIAFYMNKLPPDANILVDDAIAYPVLAFCNHIERFTLPYQGSYLSAVEAPDQYDQYILLASIKNDAMGYTQLNNKYLPAIKRANSNVKLHSVYETDNWILYKVY
jgi:hypothetical protein